MRITEKGQVTIPKHIREAAGLMPGTDVEFEFVDGEVRLVKTSGRKLSRGAALIAHLESFRDRYTMTTDEVMALTRGDPDEDY